jgi:hypothetical protein
MADPNHSVNARFCCEYPCAYASRRPYLRKACNGRQMARCVARRRQCERGAASDRVRRRRRSSAQRSPDVDSPDVNSECSAFAAAGTVRVMLRPCLKHVLHQRCDGSATQLVIALTGFSKPATVSARFNSGAAGNSHRRSVPSVGFSCVRSACAQPLRGRGVPISTCRRNISVFA